MLRLVILRCTLQCLWRICLLITLWMPNLESAEHQCKLCDSSFSSCVKQFPQHGLEEKDCRMEVYNVNTDACSSLQLEVQSRGETSGNMLLHSYLFRNSALYTQTAFNVSFYDFSWKSIAMKYTQNGNPGKNSCRIFHFSDKFLSIKPTFLFYDCLWSHNDYEGKTFNFEYAAHSDSSLTYRKSVFTVPLRDRIDPDVTILKKWQVFVNVDVTDSPFVILRAQTLPIKYEVDSYNVKAYSGTDKDNAIKEDRNITVRKEDKELIFKWDLGIFPGNYFFTVQPVSAACGDSGCLISRSPDIKIEPSNSLFLACGVFVAIIIVLAIVACVKYIPRDKSLSVRPRLLLIYRSTHSAHMKVILELAQYLRKNNIEAMFDELDVNKSETHNPFDWYNDAIAQSDFIAIISSPTCCNAINGIYPKADEMALSLLQGKGFNRRPLSNVCNVMVFLLPYCSEKALPQETKNISLRFRIPNDVNQIVNYIHNFQRKHVVGRFYYCIRNIFFWYGLHERASLKKCPGLNAAVQEASVEVKKCLGRTNRTDKSVSVETNKKIPKIVCNKDFPEAVEQPLKSNDSAPESAIYSVPYDSFPGNIDDYDLLGDESEVIEEEDLKMDNKEILLLDELTL